MKAIQYWNFEHRTKSISICLSLPFRILSIIYLKHRGEENHLSHDFSENSMFNNDPLVKTKLLGLNLGKLNFEFFCVNGELSHNLTLLSTSYYSFYLFIY